MNQTVLRGVEQISFEARIKELGLTIPETPRPVANYVPAVQVGNLIFASGQTPLAPGDCHEYLRSVQYA
jgi:enamine deaminase RidA (YjgF/YER057c/UK114 family)